jgi:hypothetical protein
LPIGNSRDRDIKVARDHITPVSPGETDSFRSVADQGDRWVFHVTSGPHDGGEFALSKIRLERAHWRVVVPPDVHQRLEAETASAAG